MTKTPLTTDQNPLLFTEIRTLIDNARHRAVVAVNTELTLLYWQVGKSIHTHILQEQRVEYGNQVVTNLAKQLTATYGKSCIRGEFTSGNEQCRPVLRDA